MTFRSVVSHANGNYIVIKHTSDECLENSGSLSNPSANLSVEPCNQSVKQAWEINLAEIRQSSNCLEANNKNNVSLNKCNVSANQVWLAYKSSLFNPSSGKCLNYSNNLVSLDDCSQNETTNWVLSGVKTSCDEYSKGQRITCNAITEWNNWQVGPMSHSNLLNTYTDGRPYDEWCADFISYVFKESNYPFTKGEYSGWDEYNANNIENMGFTKHNPNNYLPKSGDIAYFDYNGGHVEIVISGGKTPTFIYGNSATIDQSTGNGQMAANTLTSDGYNGHLVYYLTPNFK